VYCISSIKPKLLSEAPLVLLKDKKKGSPEKVLILDMEITRSDLHCLPYWGTKSCVNRWLVYGVAETGTLESNFSLLSHSISVVRTGISEAFIVEIDRFCFSEIPSTR